MDGQNIFIFLAWFLGAALLLYWLSLLLRSEAFWDRLFGLDKIQRWPEEPPEAKINPHPIGYTTYWPEKWIYKPPTPKVRVQKDFGTHCNVLALVQTEENCDGLFEQMDPRTWQCLKCHLLQFVEIQPEPKGETKP